MTEIDQSRDPIDLMLFQEEWEDILAVLNDFDKSKAEQVRYNLQCKIDVAKMRGDWKL